jgi:hypothetical protein
MLVFFLYNYDRFNSYFNGQAAPLAADSQEKGHFATGKLRRPAQQSLRELFSYRFPATGLAITKEQPSSEETFLWARRLAELAELNSECLASALAKHCIGEFKVDWLQLADLRGYETPKHELDDDDHYRLGYLSRKKVDFELMYIARQGMIEDFFGAWIADEDLGLPEHAFDPDQGYGPSLFTFV